MKNLLIKYGSWQKAPESIWTDPIHFVACGLGSGASPIAPGTMGTLLAIPFYFLIADLPLIVYLTLVLLLFGFGVWCCDKTAKDFAVHDPSAIVFDEVVGFLVTMSLLPNTWFWCILGFIAFRVFDIVKPWPIGFVDRRIKGGLGIMLDDVLAGVYAGALLQLLRIFFK